jgi:hypothetical protein
MISKVNEGAGGSKNVTRKLVTFVVTKKLEVLKIFLIVRHDLNPIGAGALKV